MFGNMIGRYTEFRAQVAAADRARREAEMQAMHNQQAAAHQAMMETGAKMIVIKPDGTIVPIYD